MVTSKAINSKLISAIHENHINYLKRFCHSCVCKSLCPSDKEPEIDALIEIEEAKRFVVDCLMSVGTCEDNAECHADVLIRNDIIGHLYSGLHKLKYYVNDIRQGICDPNANLTVIKDYPSIALVDANCGLGGVIGTQAMKLAIRKAYSSCIGWIMVKNANPFGCASYFADMAVEHNCLGIVVTNTSPCVVPTRAKDAALGTNPITIGVGGCHGVEFLLDMTTSVKSMETIEQAEAENEPIAEDWALDCCSEPTTDPKVALKARHLMPLGGTEENSGYAGAGLSMFNDILCAVSSGANYGNKVPIWNFYTSKPRNIGQLFVAIHTNSFTDNFNARVSNFCKMIRNLPSVDENIRVLVPGDLEKNAEKKTKKRKAICYSGKQINAFNKLADELKVTKLKHHISSSSNIKF